jgi:hypothetical protein
MTPEPTPRRGTRLAAGLFGGLVLAVLAAVFVYRGSRKQPATAAGQPHGAGEELRVGALPVT